jgi:hypothetical protein
MPYRSSDLYRVNSVHHSPPLLPQSLRNGLFTGILYYERELFLRRLPPFYVRVAARLLHILKVKRKQGGSARRGVLFCEIRFLSVLRRCAA